MLLCVCFCLLLLTHLETAALQFQSGQLWAGSVQYTVLAAIVGFTMLGATSLFVVLVVRETRAVCKVVRAKRLAAAIRRDVSAAALATGSAVTEAVMQSNPLHRSKRGGDGGDHEPKGEQSGPASVEGLRRENARLKALVHSLQGELVLCHSAGGTGGGGKSALKKKEFQPTLAPSATATGDDAGLPPVPKGPSRDEQRAAYEAARRAARDAAAKRASDDAAAKRASDDAAAASKALSAVVATVVKEAAAAAPATFALAERGQPVAPLIVPGALASASTEAGIAVVGTAAEAPIITESSFPWRLVRTAEGYVYYVNMATQETSWEPPPSDILLAERGAAAVAPRALHEATLSSTTEAPGTHESTGIASAAAVPEVSSFPWRLVRTAEGYVYYVNMATQETSWEAPALPPGISSFTEVSVA